MFYLADHNDHEESLSGKKYRICIIRTRHGGFLLRGTGYEKDISAESPRNGDPCTRYS